MKNLILCLFVILFAASCSKNDDNSSVLGDNGTCLMNTFWKNDTCMYSFIKNDNGTKEMDIRTLSTNKVKVLSIDNIVKKDGIYYLNVSYCIYYLDSMGHRVKRIVAEYEIQLIYHETYIDMTFEGKNIHAYLHNNGY